MIGVADDGERQSQLSPSKDERQRQGAFAGTGPLGTAVLVAQLRPAGASRHNADEEGVRPRISTFGQTPDGEIYVVDYTQGTLFRLELERSR